MRISGGVAKGRRVAVRKAFSRDTGSDELRPTSAKVREALFDILRNDLQDSLFLDLYAGTGAVGLEALSRGARKVVFVESGALRVRIIEQLLSEFNFAGRGRTVRSQACDFLKKSASREERYDIIFLDPPYSSGELMLVLPLIGKGGLLKENGKLVVEHFYKLSLPDRIERLVKIKNYRYGDTELSLYGLERK